MSQHWKLNHLMCKIKEYFTFFTYFKFLLPTLYCSTGLQQVILNFYFIPKNDPGDL